MSEMMAGISKAYDDGLAQLWLGDARDMSFLEDRSVDCVVTSPPYYSLRVWGEGADTVWDGDLKCKHVWGDEVHGPGFRSSDTRPGSLQGIATQNREKLTGQFCQLCGAWRGQLGLEPTIEVYLDHLLQITDTACRRVLKDTGVMWVNMGDSYASQGGEGYKGQTRWQHIGGRRDEEKHWDKSAPKRTLGNLKPLDLCMIPARFALAMQQRGWYLRSIVPWLKQAAMPDSIQGDRWERHRVKVGPREYPKSKWGQDSDSLRSPRVPTDGDDWSSRAEYIDCPGCPKCLPNDGLVRRKGNWRPGRSMEWLFLFSKTNDYYSDAEGVRLEAKRAGDIPGGNKQGIGQYGVSSGWAGGQVPGGRNRRQSDWLYESLDAIIADHEREARRLKHLRDNGGMLWEDGEPLALLLNPKGYKGAHFATYPVAMVEPLIMAYTSEKGNCPRCGAPWVRVVERAANPYPGSSHDHSADDEKGNVQIHSSGIPAGTIMAKRWYAKGADQTLGWRPDCECEAKRYLTDNPGLFPRTRNPRRAKAQDHSTWLTWKQRVFNRIHREYQGELKSDPAIVLDPFVGSGTTCAAATKLGRRSIGVDCVEDYLKLAIKRLGGPFEVEVKGVKMKQTGLWGGRE